MRAHRLLIPALCLLAACSGPATKSSAESLANVPLPEPSRKVPTDAATMRNWKFASNDTHILYTSNKLVEILEQSGFHQFVIKTRAIQIWPKISGLIAVATKE